MYDLKTLGAALALVVAFLSGWWINGYRWEAKHLSLVTTHEKERVAIIEKARQFEQEARQKEQALQAAVDAERKLKDEKIRSLNTELDAALVSLRQRTSRPPAPVQLPKASPDKQGSTGANLFKEDAEFLAREAARADQAVIELQSCYSAYDALIKTK